MAVVTGDPLFSVLAVDSFPAPAVPLLVTLFVTGISYVVAAVTFRNMMREWKLRSRVRTRGVSRVTLVGYWGTLPSTVALATSESAPGFVTGERQADEAATHESWLRRMLRGEIIRRGGGRRELDRLRRVALDFEIRAAGGVVDFRWRGRTHESDEGRSFVEWLAATTADRGYPTSAAELDAVLDQVFTPDADTTSTADSHPLTILAGLDDPAVDRAVLPTGPPAATRTTPFRVLSAAA